MLPANQESQTLNVCRAYKEALYHSVLTRQPLQMLPHVLHCILLSMFYGLFVFSTEHSTAGSSEFRTGLGDALEELSGPEPYRTPQ